MLLQSFQDLEDWMDIVKRVYNSNLPYLALLANKADLTHMRLVDPSQHVDFADTLSMHRWVMQTLHHEAQQYVHARSGKCRPCGKGVDVF